MRTLCCRVVAYDVKVIKKTSVLFPLVNMTSRKKAPFRNMVTDPRLKGATSANKGWNSCMDGFKESSPPRLQSPEIVVSSSDEEISKENIAKKHVKRKILFTDMASPDFTRRTIIRRVAGTAEFATWCLAGNRLSPNDNAAQRDDNISEYHNARKQMHPRHIDSFLCNIDDDLVQTLPTTEDNLIESIPSQSSKSQDSGSATDDHISCSPMTTCSSTESCSDEENWMMLDKVKRKLTTPTKSIPTEERESERKKNKNKTGFAEKLVKLLKRQRAEHHMWSYKISKGIQPSNVLQVEVLSVTTEYSTIVAECLLDATSDVTTVMFSVMNGKGIGTPPCIINILPPWHKIRISSGSEIILSGNFVHVENKSSNHQIPIKIKSSVSPVLLQTFNCKQILEPDQSCACADSLPGLAGLRALGLVESSIAQTSLSCTPSSMCMLAILPTVAEVMGAGAQTDITLSGIILRIFCCSNDKTSSGECLSPSGGLQWSLLAADTQGVMFQVLLPSVLSEHLEEFVSGGENQMVSLHRITLKQQLPWNRVGALLSVMSCCEEQLTLDKTQSIFYIFSADHQTLIEPINDINQVKRISLIDLTEITQEMSKRCSFLAKPIHQMADVLYVYSCKSYVKIIIQSNCHITEHVQQAIQCNTPLFVRDASAFQGSLFVDKLSRIFEAKEVVESNDAIGRIASEPLLLKEVTDKANIMDLVTVKGVILCVNENYIMELCSSCNKPISKLFCSSCNIPVFLAVKMRMMVVTISSVCNIGIKVQLHQRTISSFLPVSCRTKMYQHSGVVGRPVGPLSCVVLKVEKNYKTQFTTLLLQEFIIK